MKPTSATATDSPLGRFNQLRFETDGPPRFSQIMDYATKWLTLLVGFTVPLAASPSEIATTLLMMTWLLSGGWERKWAAIRSNGVALMALGMFGVLYIGIYYSSAGWLGSFKCLLKYREFLYIPLLLPIFQDPKLRRLGLQAFVAGMIVLVGLSYFEWISGLDLCLPSAPTDSGAQHDYVTFKDRIIHSVMAAFLIYIAAWKVMEPDAHSLSKKGSDPWEPASIARENRWFERVRPLFRQAVRKWFWWCFIALALGNILWLLQGRTGYVVLGALTVLFMAQQFGSRGIIYAATLLTAIAAIGCCFIPSVQYRVEFTLQQLESHFGPERKPFWDGRLEFYSNTITLIRQHPYFGTGTGSFEREYGELARRQGFAATVDPHNEYLLLTAQTGLFGGCFFVALLLTHARLSSRLPLQERRMARGVLLATTVGCLFNSLMLSQTGVFYSYFTALAFGALELKTASLPAAETPAAAHDEQDVSPRLAA